jgi:hypothetical protein
VRSRKFTGTEDADTILKDWALAVAKKTGDQSHVELAQEAGVDHAMWLVAAYNAIIFLYDNGELSLYSDSNNPPIPGPIGRTLQNFGLERDDVIELITSSGKSRKFPAERLLRKFFVGQRPAEISGGTYTDKQGFVRSATLPAEPPKSSGQGAITGVGGPAHVNREIRWHKPPAPPADDPIYKLVHPPPTAESIVDNLLDPQC